jgi:hypothetical protein
MMLKYVRQLWLQGFPRVFAFPKFISFFYSWLLQEKLVPPVNDWFMSLLSTRIPAVNRCLQFSVALISIFLRGNRFLYFPPRQTVGEDDLKVVSAEEFNDSREYNTDREVVDLCKREIRRLSSDLRSKNDNLLMPSPQRADGLFERFVCYSIQEEYGNFENSRNSLN